MPKKTKRNTMKKLAITLSFLSIITLKAQDNNNFDKKFRFGVRISPQPTWISSKNNKNISNGGMGFGFGFGLIMEFKLSDIIHFSTGIGGDFENGNITYKNDVTNGYFVRYMTTKDGGLVQASNGTDVASFYGNNNVEYGGISSRKIKTTYVTIPLTLKMLTQEYSGFKYFAQFGADLGFRTKLSVSDECTQTRVGINVTQATINNTDLNFKADGSLIPIRIGLNAGLGTEYRIAGSTSLLFSINYFTAFTNLMRNTSKYMYSNVNVDSNGKLQFTYIQQTLIQNAIRINIGILF